MGNVIKENDIRWQRIFSPNPLPTPPGSFGKSGKSSRALTRSTHNAKWLPMRLDLLWWEGGAQADIVRAV